MNHVSRVAATCPRKTARAPPAPPSPQGGFRGKTIGKPWENHRKTIGKP